MTKYQRTKNPGLCALVANIAGGTSRHQPMGVGHMTVLQLRGPMGFRVLQWCHPVLVLAKRTSYCTWMITLYGARKWIQARAILSLCEFFTSWCHKDMSCHYHRRILLHLPRPITYFSNPSIYRFITRGDDTCKASVESDLLVQRLDFIYNDPREPRDEMSMSCVRHDG